VAHLRIACIAAVLLALAAPERAAAQQPASPETAVHEFMRAVRDSNLTRMMELWGNEKGSAARTKQPPDYQKRVYIMYAYLKGVSHRIVMVQPDTSQGRSRAMLVEFTRADCQKTAMVNTKKSKQDGWLVNAIDLAVIGVPGRPCTSQGGDSVVRN
jgi:hypothetical protein